MVQYLTKEEVKQWRSSLEKITLEEFARRLGKEIEENKRTHDIVDMLVNNEAVSTTDDIKVQEPAEQTQTKAVATQQAPVKTVSSIVFSKALTEREQRVFDYLLEKKGESVKAQDLACVLDIPRDYIYKYIRNLRKKMAEDLLVNSDEGGFILNV
ncbi:MAG: helix-turn-helix domain-containing protein [Candidatus Gastranaerophilales bacterium]|jgi:Fic family protein|nr:helix-turn-helix domain-containing protein [Candidatus Gastranaerophilales bacterium]